MTSPLAPIGTLADVALGKMLQGSRTRSDDELRPYLRAAHVQPNGVLDRSVAEKEMWFSSAERHALDLRRGDVVVVEGGAGFGRAAYVEDDLDGWCFQNSIVRVRPELAKADGRFISYALRAALASGAIEVSTSTATIPHFTAEKVGRFRVPAPGREQQRRLAEFLDRETAEIDAMDAELNHLIRLLQERVNSSISSRLHDTAGAPTMPLQYLADVTVGIVIQPSKLYVPPGEGVPALRGLNVGDGQIKPADLVHISHEGDQANKKSRLRAGDLVTVRTGQVGVSAVVPDEFDGANAIDLVITRPHPLLDARFLYWYMRWPATLGLLDAEKVGAVQSHFNVGAMKSLAVPVIPVEMQREIVAELDDEMVRIDQMIDDANRLKALLRERRSTLITEVVTGKKEVFA